VIKCLSGTTPMNTKATLLLVDDEPVNIQLLAATLKDTYQLKVATSGKQCLQLVATDPKPDLILLDIDMPDMDGYQVCEHLKHNHNSAEIPIIFVTAMQSTADEEKGLLLGAVDYVTKPVRPPILLARIATHIQLKNQRDSLIKMAIRDQLTGLFNRHYLLETANHRVAKVMRNDFPVSVLMMDIDHFKSINDTYGHQAGDVVLKAFAGLLNQESREEDIVSRFGGEEFVIFLDECNVFTAEKIAERIRQRVEEFHPENIEVTVSIGVAELRKGKEGFSDLIKRADDAMYQAKKQGRNRVIVDTNH